MYLAVAIAGLVLTGGAPILESAAQGTSVAPSAAIEDLLWWLPPDTETVQVTQTRTGARGPLFEAMEMANGKVEFGDVASASVGCNPVRR